jgi:hypothetical protein
MKYRGPKAHSNGLRNPETRAVRGIDFVAAAFRSFVARGHDSVALDGGMGRFSRVSPKLPGRAVSPRAVGDPGQKSEAGQSARLA